MGILIPDPSLVATDDGATGRPCGWCRELLPTTASARRRFCSQPCRQSAFRLRQRHAAAGATDTPGTFRYADPPYPGTSSKYYRDEPSFAGEVDFPRLILELTTAHEKGETLGWALSTSARSLRELLPLCPAEARVCAWVKPIGVSSRTYGLHNTWEPLIVVVGRHRRPGKRDWLRAMPARLGGTLPGRKPIAFCAWLFDVLGMLPGDTLIDMFPGTGIVSRAWRELSSRTSSTTVSSGSAATVTIPDSATVVAARGATVTVDDADRRRSLVAAATDASLVDERDVVHAGVDDDNNGYQ